MKELEAHMMQPIEDLPMTQRVIANKKPEWTPRPWVRGQRGELASA